MDNDGQERAVKIAEGIVRLVKNGTIDDSWSDIADMVELGYLPIKELHEARELETKRVLMKVYSGMGVHLFTKDIIPSKSGVLEKILCRNCQELTYTNRPRCMNCGGNFS
ncbi:hypothetical protein QTG56_22525 (plasmid) [Rossellomorea sp. AcN35-11]|nr:hypothetical protein [Rossellomorea aquimaris]WJV32149.1 hypothetical protein QTG56_22525 [Rossellomorea sp. AcN35-11]